MTPARRSLPARAKNWFLWKAGPGLSKLGERLGVDALTYNPLLYYSFNELAKQNAPGVIDAITAQFPKAWSYLDAGCGGGAFAHYADTIGHNVTGCEYSPHGRAYAKRQGVRVHPFDLTQDVPTDITGHFNVAYCFEVAEHLKPEIGDRLVKFLVGKADIIVFTAAQPGQGGSGHINEQPKIYWIERFVAAGAHYDAKASMELAGAFLKAGVSTWFPNNVVVFRTT